MNLLQLYIAKSLRGYKSLVSFNATDEVARHVVDVRRALAAVHYDPAEKIIVYLVSYIPEGTLLTILRTIPSEPLDHLAATVFVPAVSAITARELDHVVREVTRKISAPAMKGEDVARLRELFAKEYPDRPQAPVLRASAAGADYAVELYGGDTGVELIDFLGDNLYDARRTALAGTLLVDAELLPETEPEPQPQPAPEPEPEPTPAPAPVQKPAPKATPKAAPAPAPAADAPARGFTLRQLLITAGVSLVLGIVIGFCLFAGGSDEKVGHRDPSPEPLEAPATAPATTAAPEAPAATAPQGAAEAPAQPAATLADAVAYLDANSVWRRDAMERLAPIAGLFDDLNNLNINRITDHWAPLLKDSKSFATVARAADGCKRKKVDVHREARTTYNKPGDTAISPRNYTFWIDP